MKARDVLDLLTLGMLWGVSFLLIRVAVPEFGAVALIEVRMALAAAVLVPLVMARGQVREIAANWRPIALMGLLHYAIPFSLFAWSMLTLSAGYASVVNASSPLFAGLVARLWLGDRLEPARIAGLAIGFSGVVLLLWEKLGPGDGPAALAMAAAMLGAFCYGFAAVLARKRLAGVSPTAVAGGSMAFAALALLPVSAWLWPAATPSATAWGATAVLGIVSTAFAFVLYFRLIASVGPARAITVTFIVPLFAILSGVAVLAEPVTPAMVAGGLVVIVGTALSTGLVTPRGLLRHAGIATLVLLAATVEDDDIPADVHVPAMAMEAAGYADGGCFGLGRSECDTSRESAT